MHMIDHIHDIAGICSAETRDRFLALLPQENNDTLSGKIIAEYAALFYARKPSAERVRLFILLSTAAGNPESLLYLTYAGNLSDRILRRFADILLTTQLPLEKTPVIDVLEKKHPRFFMIYIDALCEHSPAKALRLSARSRSHAHHIAKNNTNNDHWRAADYMFLIQETCDVIAEKNISLDNKLSRLQRCAPPNIHTDQADTLDALCIAVNVKDEGDIRVKRLEQAFQSHSVSDKDMCGLIHDMHHIEDPACRIESARYAVSRGYTSQALMLLEDIKCSSKEHMLACACLRTDILLSYQQYEAAASEAKQSVGYAISDPDNLAARHIHLNLAKALVGLNDIKKLRKLMPRLQYYCKKTPDLLEEFDEIIYRAEGNEDALSHLYAAKTARAEEALTDGTCDAALDYIRCLIAKGSFEEGMIIADAAFKAAAAISAVEGVRVAGFLADIYMREHMHDAAREYQVYITETVKDIGFTLEAVSSIAHIQGPETAAEYIRAEAVKLCDISLLKEYITYAMTSGLVAQDIFVKEDVKAAMHVLHTASGSSVDTLLLSARLALAYGDADEAEHMCQRIRYYKETPAAIEALCGYGAEIKRQPKAALDYYERYTALAPNGNESESLRVKHRMTALHFRFGKHKNARSAYQSSARVTASLYKKDGAAGGFSLRSLLPALMTKAVTSRMVLLRGPATEQLRESAMLDMFSNDNAALTVSCSADISPLLMHTYPEANIISHDGGEGVPAYMRDAGFSRATKGMAKTCDDVLTPEDLVLRFLEAAPRKRKQRYIEVPERFVSAAKLLMTTAMDPQDSRLKAGIVWRDPAKRGKSGGYGLSAHALLSLMRRTESDIIWVCLQTDVTETEQAVLAARPNIVFLPDLNAEDITMLAALTTQLDRVLTFDRTIADLASSVGTETFFHEESALRSNGVIPTLADERSPLSGASPSLRYISSAHDAPQMLLDDEASIPSGFLPRATHDDR